MLERQLGELHSEPVEDFRRDVAVFGEQTDLFGPLSGFVEHLQTLAPSRLLGVVDLAQVEDGALSGGTSTQPAVLDHAPVAMSLAVLFASVIAQKHVVGRQYITVAERGGRG